MKIVTCDQCDCMMINGVFCHETGCINSSKPLVMKDNDYYSDIVSRPGKFEGCPAYVPYFWDIYLDCGPDRDDGKALGFDIDQSDKAIFPELRKRRTVKLIETDQGFVCEV